MLAYLCRLPVSSIFLTYEFFLNLDIYFNLVQIPEKRLDDCLGSDNGDDDTLSDASSTIEEIRDDENKIVRPCHQRHLAV